MHFSVLGPLEVASSHSRVSVQGVRRQVLLATLLLHSGQVIPMSRLVDALWPERPPRSAVENIRTYVSELRTRLRRAGDRERLESHPGAYRLQAEPQELDLLRFNSFSAAGQKALRAGDYPNSALLLGRARALWRGAPLGGLPLGQVLAAKRTALEEHYHILQSDWIKARLELGEQAELVPLLREMVTERPLDEGLWCSLVASLQELGRTGEALAACASARRTLVTELGIEPGAELQQLQQTILSGQRPRSGPVPAARQRETAVPWQIPSPVAGFVGRRRELADLRKLLRHDSDRTSPSPTSVIALYGQPGVGKTAAALTVAAEARADFPDGQLHVDMRGSTTAPTSSADALVTLLNGFGLVREEIPGTLEGRASLFRALLAERRALILLDDVGTTGQIRPLIPGGRSVVLMTGRRWLADVAVIGTPMIGPLSTDEGVHLLRGIIGEGKTQDAQGILARIAEGCGRLPLALRIAGLRLAARPAYPLPLLAERLGDPQQVLEELSMSGVSVRACFESSYRALTPEAQRCFCAVGAACPDGVSTVEVAARLGTPVASADRQLERLMHHCLLTEHRIGEGADYRMPTLLHAYARERLAQHSDVLATDFSARGAVQTLVRR